MSDYFYLPRINQFFEKFAYCFVESAFDAFQSSGEYAPKAAQSRGSNAFVFTTYFNSSKLRLYLDFVRDFENNAKQINAKNLNIVFFFQATTALSNMILDRGKRFAMPVKIWRKLRW